MTNRIFSCMALLLASSLLHAAHPSLCPSFVDQMQAYAKTIQKNPNKPCQAGDQGYPYWMDDPEKHWRFCDSPWVSAQQLKVELKKAKAFIQKHCPCDEGETRPSFLERLWGTEHGPLPQ